MVELAREFYVPPGFMSSQEETEARERGRRLAAEALRCHPAKREFMEKKYGIKFCMNRYPEAYSKEMR